MVNAYRPKCLAEALNLRATTKGILFAGGTDLMVTHRVRASNSPSFEKSVLFVDEIGELKHVSQLDDDKLLVGAAVPLSELESHPDVPDILKEAIVRIAAPAVRNRATLIGNICNASPAADSLPVLYLLDCVVIAQAETGMRRIPLRDFIIGPGKTLIREDEIVTHVELLRKEWSHTFYHKVGTRAANALTKVSVAGVAQAYQNNGEIVLRDWRVAFGAVGPTVVRDPMLEKLIINKPLKAVKANLSSIVEQYAEVINPITDQRSTSHYRTRTALNLLRHWLTQIDHFH